MDIVFFINAGIVLITLVFLAFFIVDLIKHKEDLKDGGIVKTIKASAISIVTLFFDTLGIGCYAPMTASFKGLKVMDDRLIPGTLNTACTVAMSFEAIVFITKVEVEALTLIVLVGSATIGAFIGAGLVARLPVKKMRLGMGCALLVVVGVMLLGMFGLMPVGGEAVALTGAKLVISGVLCFIFGALMTIGVGAYAPIMATVYLMGLSPLVAFPVMMGACAYLIPAAGIRFIKKGAYDRKTALIANTIGLIGVAIAVFWITSMDLYILKWLVVVVVTYTGIVMLRDGIRKQAGPSAGEPISNG